MDRFLCVAFCVLVMVVAVVVLASYGTPDVEPTITETLPTASNISEEPTEATTEPTKSTEPTVVLYDVPLSEELQLHITNLCERHHINPAIIVSMIFWESSFRADVMGDNGDSYGLMQIQPKWHYDRMQKLGCTNLLDPFQNVTVGVDILAEQIARYNGDVTKAIVAYNQGSYYGTVTQYAKNILAYAEEINNERGQ